VGPVGLALELTEELVGLALELWVEELCIDVVFEVVLGLRHCHLLGCVDSTCEMR
jgi:hypothetical protein